MSSDYLPDPDLSMEWLIAWYMQEKPLVITTTNDPAEDAYRRGQWFKAAEKLIRQRADEAIPYLEKYPTHPLATELLPTTDVAATVARLMEKVAADKQKWREVQDQIIALPPEGLFDAVAPYFDASQPEMVRAIAVAVVGQTNDPRRIPILREAVQSDSMNLYSPAIYWLGEAGEGADLIAPYLEHSGATRIAAVNALFKMGDERGIAAVREKAYRLAKDGKKTQAIDELAKIANERKARRILGQMARDKDYMVKTRALQAIKKLSNHPDKAVANWAQKQR
jgi:hypothetical protein